MPPSQQNATPIISTVDVYFNRIALGLCADAHAIKQVRVSMIISTYRFLHVGFQLRVAPPYSNPQRGLCTPLGTTVLETRFAPLPLVNF